MRRRRKMAVRRGANGVARSAINFNNETKAATRGIISLLVFFSSTHGLSADN